MPALDLRLIMLLRCFDKIKIYIIVNFLWKIIPSKKLETLRNFEATEDDSAWQLLNGIKITSDSSEKAEFFLQALEENHHAELFRELCKKYGHGKFQKYFSEKKPLYSLKEDSWRMPIYCLVGEKAAAERFQNIIDVSQNSLLRVNLQKIVSDEVGHIHKAEEQIKIDGKSKKEVSTEMKKIIRKRYLEAWMRSGRRITGLLINTLLFIIYITFGSIFSFYLMLKRLSFNRHLVVLNVENTVDLKKAKV